MSAVFPKWQICPSQIPLKISYFRCFRRNPNFRSDWLSQIPLGGSCLSVALGSLGASGVVGHPIVKRSDPENLTSGFLVRPKKTRYKMAVLVFAQTSLCVIKARS